jgi:hypothetical protein
MFADGPLLQLPSLPARAPVFIAPRHESNDLTNLHDLHVHRVDCLTAGTLSTTATNTGLWAAPVQKSLLCDFGRPSLISITAL